MSPLSDTTNLAPAMAGTDLYTHIKHMTYTSGVAMVLTLILTTALGLFWGGNQTDTESIRQILDTLQSQFSINPVFLIPPLLVLGLAVWKIPAIPGIAAGAVAAALLGFVLQGNTFQQALDAAYSGYVSATGIDVVDSLLTKGGFTSMLYAISLVICAMMFGGIMEHTNQMKVIVNYILKKATSSKSLITSTVFTALGANLILCDQYMTVVMTGRMYAQAYRDRGLHPKNLSRVVEDAGTVTASLVPWNSGGAYQTATLGVPTFLYAPFAFFNWLSPVVTLIFGWMGWTIAPLDEEEQRVLEEAPAETGSEI